MTHIFWFSLIILLYTYLGYPLYVVMRASLSKRPARKDAAFKPFVSVIISVYNEEAFMARKIDNLLQSEYPLDRMEILIGSDGSRDRTNEILTKISSDRIRTFIFQNRRGKASVLNDLVARARGEILVFCDARQTFDKDAIRRLAANFADKDIGCVSGELVFTENFDSDGIAEGIGIYWDYEKLMRRSESAIHSMVGATGAIYAVRKKLYKEVPPNTILDDIFIPLSVVRQGYRSIWDSDAKAYDKPASSPDEEYRRKVRTLAGNYQIFVMFKDLFIPFKSAVFMPLLSHKLLRLPAPFFMIALFATSLVLAKDGIYGVFLMLQIIFYLLALMGGMTYKKKEGRLILRLASIMYTFCLLNFTALAGLYRFLLERQNIAWEK